MTDDDYEQMALLLAERLPAVEITSCQFCVCSVGQKPLCNWEMLERCKQPPLEEVVAKYFGIDSWKVRQERRNHPTLDSCLRCLSRQFRKSLYDLSRTWDSALSLRAMKPKK